MTEQYKIDLINYITNQVITTSPNWEEEIFVEEENVDYSKWQDFIPSNAATVRYEGMVAGNETTSSLTILYGGWKDMRNISYGIITLVDENFVPVKSIYTFDNGNPLRYIQFMKQADDGTFYWIDDMVFTFDNGVNAKNSEKRFVMTNNFTILSQITNDYSITLRKSYAFDNNYKNFYCKEIFKDPNSSYYIMFGQAVYSTTNRFDYMRIIGLKINVGSANEWTNFYSSSGSDTRVFGGAYVLFDSSNNAYFRCLTCSSAIGARNLDCISKTYTGNVVIEPLIMFPITPYIDSYNYSNQCVFQTMDRVYYVINTCHHRTIGERFQVGLYVYDFNVGGNMTIYERQFDETLDNFEQISVVRNNENIYVYYITNIWFTNIYKADYHVQRLVSDRWEPHLIAERAPYQPGDRNIFVKNNYNLLQIFLWCNNPENSDTWFQYAIKEDYNLLNYNGSEYTDYDSLWARKANLYSNGKLVFARNLYNESLYSNMTVSTLQVPSGYVNNLDIDEKDLISKTNTIMVKDYEVIQKNIYEVLLINFINIINVIDEDTGINYPAVASYINRNIYGGSQQYCEDTYIGKIRITKSGVETIQPIVWHEIDETHKQTKFSLYIDELINKIEFISNDETTIYLTKDLSELEVGKTYTITQYLRVE